MREKDNSPDDFVGERTIEMSAIWLAIILESPKTPHIVRYRVTKAVQELVDDGVFTKESGKKLLRPMEQDDLYSDILDLRDPNFFQAFSEQTPPGRPPEPRRDLNMDDLFDDLNLTWEPGPALDPSIPLDLLEFEPDRELVGIQNGKSENPVYC